MKLYSAPLSLFARKVEIALAEKGLSFERELVAFSQSEGYSPKHPAVIAANPKKQVPVLVDGDLTLFDSTVIFEYLEDAYPQPPLMPRDPKGRARCRLLELTADEILLRPLAKLMYRTEPEHSDPERRRQQAAEAEQAERELLDLYGMVASKLEGPYLCGAFTTADIAMFMSVLYSLRLGGPKLASIPTLQAWHDAVGSRPTVAAVALEVAEADRRLSRKA
ncbi:Glutathione S-transferase, N-terminal domain [alpha proteobacterium BAL199]|jgi:glutathione S-transferase|nr:Glutathione S-transferase, N-terminal domain [alpha proteobacterium BAL199]